MKWFRRDNTEGYSDDTLKVMNELMDKIFANLDEEERRNKSLLDYLMEEILFQLKRRKEMYKKEKMVKTIMTVIEGLRTLNYAVECPEKGCEKCPAHLSKAIQINGQITRCMFILPGLLKMEIDNCME